MRKPWETTGFAGTFNINFRGKDTVVLIGTVLYYTQPLLANNIPSTPVSGSYWEDIHTGGGETGSNRTQGNPKETTLVDLPSSLLPSPHL